jgi:hypothetical protein
VLWARGVSVFVVSALATACLGEECDRHRGDPLEFRGGNTLGDDQYYETGSLDQPFLHFPAGRSYALVHGLHQAPSEFHAYLAFAECPLSKSERRPGAPPRCAPIDAESGGGGFSEGAGNEAIFEVRDDRVIVVRNDTCAEFYLRVVASTTPSVAGETDAGSP